MAAAWRAGPNGESSTQSVVDAIEAGEIELRLEVEGEGGQDELTPEEATVLRELGYWVTGYWCKLSGSSGGHVSELLDQIISAAYVRPPAAIPDQGWLLASLRLAAPRARELLNVIPPPTGIPCCCVKAAVRQATACRGGD